MDPGGVTCGQGCFFPETKIIIHRANGADSGVDPFYAGLVEAGLKDSDYDIIGLSYYPDSIYTSSINELSSNMNLLAAKIWQGSYGRGGWRRCEQECR
ncbi:glycosyl hydrolase 53 family protein [Paenibacillus rhizoplanae]